MQCEIIVFQVLHSPTLPHVEIPLREYVLKTFVVREYLELLSIQIMTSCFQGKDNGRQLHIVCKVMQCEIIVFQVLHSPTLPHVEIPLSEYVLKTFVVREYLELLSIQIMTSCFQGKDNGRQLHIVCRVILLVILQLPKTISHNPPGLHQNTT